MCLAIACVNCECTSSAIVITSGSSWLKSRALRLFCKVPKRVHLQDSHQHRRRVALRLSHLPMGNGSEGRDGIGFLSGNVGRSQTQNQFFDQLRKQDVQPFTSALAALGSSASNGERTLAADARKRISLARKARWAKARRGSQPGPRSAKATGLTIVKRTISAGRKRIAAAQRARWAKMKAGKEAA
jgi:hypothetical protein